MYISVAIDYNKSSKEEVILKLLTNYIKHKSLKKQISINIFNSICVWDLDVAVCFMW